MPDDTQDAPSPSGGPAPQSTPVQPPSPQPTALPPAPPVAPAPLAPHAAGSLPVGFEWPAIHPEGWPFAGGAAAIALVCWLAGWSTPGWLMAGLALFITAFFRDPARASPLGEGLLLAPADGLVSQIARVELPRQLVGEGALTAGTATRVSIFMSVFDVHVNRTPIAGLVRRLVYVPGTFLNADLDKASEENERQYLLIEAADGTRVGFTQIAGLVARRIVSFVREGSLVGTGQRVGLIRFGSRVDIFLPEGFEPTVAKGQTTLAGETVIAARGAMPARASDRQ